MYSILSDDVHSTQRGFTHTGWHATSCSSCFRFHIWFLHLGPRSYLQWLHWRRCRGLTGVFVAAVSQWVAIWFNRVSFDKIWSRLHLAEVLLEPWLTFVEEEQKMIAKTSGKFWRIYRRLQITMVWVTANSPNLLETNHAGNWGRLQKVPTVPQCPVSQSDVVCLFCKINGGERQPKSHVWCI